MKCNSKCIFTGNFKGDFKGNFKGNKQGNSKGKCEGNLKGNLAGGTEAILEVILKGNFEIQTIYNGVDVSKVFTDSQKKTLLQELEVDKAETKYLLQVASFRNQKDQDTVIRALPHMNPQVKLLFVGDGPRNKVCQELVHELDLTNRVSFLGLRDNVNEIYGLADIVVMSSHYEGFGRAAVEGMAARKPVIASNVAGLSEIVKNHGLLFTSGNSLELSKLVNELLSDKELYNEIDLHRITLSKFEFI